MSRNNNILRAAIASALGVVAGQAVAVVDHSVSPATGITKFANEIPTNTLAVGNTGSNLELKIAAPAGYAIDAAGSNPFFVKIQLTAGSVFKGTPRVVCSANTGGATAVTGAITVGGANDSAVTFNVIKAGDTATLSGFCTISAHTGIGVVSGTSRNVNFSATVEYKNGLTNVVSGMSGSYITFVNGFTATITSAGAIVVDATSGSDNFSAGSAAITSALASAGLVRFAPTGTSAATAGGAANVVLGEVLGANSGSVTVSGPSLAAALATNGVSGVFLDANTADNCATKTYTVGSTAAGSVTFTGISTAALETSGVVVCLNVSGAATQIQTGALTATIGGGLLTNVTMSFAAATGSLSTLTQNGTTRNAYFVNASTSTAKTSIIRIVNTGGNSGTIRATAYVVGDGAMVGGVPVASSAAAGTANATIATLAPNESISLTSADLETLLGYAPAAATTKYRVVFSAGLAGFKVLNYTRDVATGAIALSQAQDD